MDEFCLGVITEVVVSEEAVFSQLDCQVHPRCFAWLRVFDVPDLDGASQDEIHLKHFFILVVDHVFSVFLTETAGLQAKGDVVQELAVSILLCVEEEPELVENVVEEVVHD